MASEFEIIEQYFSFSNNNALGSASASSTVVGVGDDAACLKLGSEHLLVATDTLVSGVHFPADAEPVDIASRALNVNLSDFAAMGAVPQWLTLALTLPDNNEQWLSKFSASLARGCAKYGVSLVGGDTTRGPLTVTFTVMGVPITARTSAVNDDPSFTVPSLNSANCLRRSGAQAGDEVWVSGSLGKGAAALQMITQNHTARASWLLTDRQRENLHAAFYAPVPQLRLGRALVGVASAAIDVSDGLLADAEHIASQSKVMLELNGDALPMHPALASLSDTVLAKKWMLSGGDDYELFFTVPEKDHNKVVMLAETVGVTCTLIGKVFDAAEYDAQHGERVILNGDGWTKPNEVGFKHF